jgi:hypothetical protein
MELLESSFDLMSNPLFNITKRAPWMMPTPFVLNDAVVIKQKIIPGQITRYSARYSKPTFTKKHVQFSKKVIKGKDNTKFKNLRKPPLQ